MKNILIPVDFSDTSAAALRFGTYLAEVMDLDLRVVHVFDANFNFAQAVSTAALLAEKEKLEEKLAQFTQTHTYPVLATFQGNLETLPAIKKQVFEGFPAQTIRALSAEEETELVVMGGVGAGKKDNPPGLFGGVASGVVLNGSCPAILLPPDYGYPSVLSMAIAFGKAEELEQMGGIVRKIIKVLRPEVRFVHVEAGDRSPEWENDDKFLELALEPGFPSYTFGYDALPPGPVSVRLLDYTVKKEIGMLVLGHQVRSLWDSLFTRSRVKPIMKGCEVPLLVVPLPPKK
jgi:nucleotide-binding universal stress UspA family protein